MENTAVAIKNLAFSYRTRYQEKERSGQAPLLNIPSWTVSKGERVFLHGPSGSGKSTLLNILSGLLPHKIGTVQVLGHALSSMSNSQRDHFRAQHIGYVFQQFNLIPYLSAIENIQLAQQFAKSKQTNNGKAHIHRLLNSLGLDSEQHSKPSSLLSIGQQQRVAIARALINEPEILIADEPTSSLDQANRDRFMETLNQIAQARNMTLLFISHDRSLEKHFERIDSLAQLNIQEEGARACS